MMIGACTGPAVAVPRQRWRPPPTQHTARPCASARQLTANPSLPLPGGTIAKLSGSLLNGTALSAAPQPSFEQCGESCAADEQCDIFQFCDYVNLPGQVSAHGPLCSGGLGGGLVRGSASLPRS